MAFYDIFPTTPLLDDFNRPDEDPATTNWTTPLWSGEGNAELFNQQFVRRGGVGAWYDLATFNVANVEMWATLVEVPSLDGYPVHSYFVANPGGLSTSATLYHGSFVRTAGQWYTTISRINSGVTTFLQADYGPITALSDGDGIGFRCINNVLYLYHRVGPSGNPWLLVTYYDDSLNAARLTGQIYLAVGQDQATKHWDNFGGGVSNIGGSTMLQSHPIFRTRGG